MNNIRELREKAMLTQRTLGEKVGVDRTTVVKWETGGTNPTAKKLPAVADALGCTVDELLRKET